VANRNAGFSRALPARLYSPVLLDPVYGYQSVNVEAQLSDSSSLLHWHAQHDRTAQVVPRCSAAAPSSSCGRPTARSWPTYAFSEEEQILCVANLSRLPSRWNWTCPFSRRGSG